MNGEEIKNVAYLGDGVYVRNDGHSIAVMANSHLAPTDTIYLEKEVIEDFIMFLRKQGWIKDGKL